jgi:hypothetical protein
MVASRPVDVGFNITKITKVSLEAVYFVCPTGTSRKANGL